MYLYCLDQAEDLFGGVGQVLAGGFRGHGFFQGGYGVEDGEEGVNAVLVAEAGFRGGAAGESKDCFVVFFCDGGDTDGGFSHDGLAIEAAFTGDHDVSIFDAGFQSGFFQDDLDAGLEDGICVGKESETESTGGSGARVVRVGIRVFFTGCWRRWQAIDPSGGSCPEWLLFAARRWRCSPGDHKAGWLHRRRF